MWPSCSSQVVLSSWDQNKNILRNEGLELEKAYITIVLIVKFLDSDIISEIMHEPGWITKWCRRN